MAITSSSTFADIQAQFIDNSAYDVNASVVECRLFIHACRVYLLKTPKRQRHGGASGDETEMDPTLVKSMLDKAEAWLAANDTASTAANVGGGGSLRYENNGSFRD
jgi:hypothetical protein